METTKTKMALKISGIALLLHIVLIAISILEVFIYSLVYPDQPEAAYQHHATVSGPYVSAIAGSILIYLIVRRMNKRNGLHPYFTGLLFPVIYIAFDVIILLFFPVNWLEHLPVFLLANGVKIIAGILAAWRSGK